MIIDQKSHCDHLLKYKYSPLQYSDNNFMEVFGWNIKIFDFVTQF